MLFPTLLLACVSGPNRATLEAQLAVQDAKLAELEARLEAKDAKIAEQAARLEAAIGASAPSDLGLPVTATDPETGELYPLLSEKSVLGCVHQTLSGVKTAELAYDAAFDEFVEDFTALGWVFDNSTGCHRYLAVRVTVPEEDEGMEFVATGLVTHGAARGRRFEVDKRNATREVESLDEPAIEAWLAQPGWLGAAR